MDREECDYFEPISRKDKICRYFTGDTIKKRDIERCRFHCTILESKKMMEQGEVMEKVHGRWRRK